MIVGIDFGTTKSVAAVMEGGVPKVVTTRAGQWKMPSLVVVGKDEQIHVGWEAEKHALTGASYTISSIKRRL